MGEEARDVNGRPLDIPRHYQATNLGSDSELDSTERTVKHPAERFDRGMGESALGLAEGCSEEVRAVDEFRMVPIPTDTVVVRSPLVLVGRVLRDNGNIAWGGGGGEIGRRCRCVAQV